MACRRLDSRRRRWRARREPRALQHLAAERFLVRGAAGGDRHRRLDRPEEADLDAADDVGLGQLSAVAAVLDGIEEETLVGFGEATVRLELRRGVTIGRLVGILGRFARKAGESDDQDQGQSGDHPAARHSAPVSGSGPRSPSQ
jgi:hypothetical protein